MRIGLIADIHGDLVALDTVLADLDASRVDQIVCLGDVAALGPQPTEVIARLRDLAYSGVLGNTDAWLVDPGLLESAPPVSASARRLTYWCADRLSAEDRGYLQKLPATLTVPLDTGVELLGFHGSPRSDEDVIAATTPEPELEIMLGGQQAAILAGGHTHVQLVRRHGDAHLVNPGSVGLPGVGPDSPYLQINRGVRWAEYAVLSAADGRLSIDLRRVPLELERVLQTARAAGMPEYDWWASRWDTFA